MGWKLNATVGAALIGVVGAVSVAFINGWFGMHKTDDKAQPERSCTFPAVQFDAPSQVGGTFEATTRLMCPPPKGTKYYLISQMDNIGTKGTKHPIFCPRDPISPDSEKKTYTSEQDVHTSPVGTARSLYYIRVDEDQEQKLLDNQHDNCALGLPAGADKVSNTVEIKRSW